jgi:hypothetical protein
MKPVTLLVLAVPWSFASASQAQTMTVEIIDQMDSSTRYSYYVPEQSTTRANANATCYGASSTVSCSGSAISRTTSTPARSGGYDVSGATLSLLLVDGRIAVVNCASKYALKADYVNRRSCRVPPSRYIQAEFKGDNAKLRWPVSLDGTKFQTETYKIIAVRP